MRPDFTDCPSAEQKLWMEFDEQKRVEAEKKRFEEWKKKQEEKAAANE